MLGRGALHRGSRPLPGPGAPSSFSETPFLQVGVQQGSGGAVLTSPKLAFQCHQAAPSQVSAHCPAVDCSRACRNGSHDLTVFSTQSGHKGLFCFLLPLLTQTVLCGISFWLSSTCFIPPPGLPPLSNLSICHLEVL